jgi:hypothetical protein
MAGYSRTGAWDILERDEASGIRTADIFRAGTNIHLRGRFSALENIVPVVCQGVQQPGHEIVIQWTEESSNQAHLPRVGQQVQFYTMTGGVLYVAKGQIVKLSEGRLPRIRSNVEQTCLAVPLRKHARYQVLGQVRLGEPGDKQAYRQKQLHGMDISLGGFGLEAPDRGWQVGQETGIQIVVWVGIDGQPADDFPQLELQGRAIIRNVRPEAKAGTVSLGLQFAEITESQLATLELWLLAHTAYLREI